MKSSNNILKTLVIFLAVVLFVGFASVPLHLNAASAVQLTVSDASGKAGDEVTVSIKVPAESKLSAVDFVLKYDNEKLIYKNNNPGAAAVGGMASINPNFKIADNSNALKGAFIHTTGVTAAGSLLDVTFTVSSGWSGTTPITLEVLGSLIDADFNKIPFQVKNGTITVGAAVTTTVATTKPDVPMTTSSGVTTTAKPTTTRTEQVTDKDGSKVTVTDEVGSTVYKTAVVYETVARTEFVTDAGGSKVTEKDEAGSTVYKTTVVYEKVVGTEYVTGEDGSKVFETDESGSTVYKTTLIYETVDSTDLDEKSETDNTSGEGAMGSMSTAQKTAIIVALVCVILAVALLVAYKRKKDAVK